MMRGKLQHSMTKMMNLELNTYQVLTHFNVCLVTSVHFRSRIIELNDLQEKELQRMCEALMLTKLGLGKYAQELQCMRKRVP